MRMATAISGVLLVAASVVADEKAPAPAPAPSVPTEHVPPNLPVFGTLEVVDPAHRLAMLEADKPLPEADPLIARAANLLSGLTANYVEDAPRIAELTARATAAIRASKRPASPLEIMEGALLWKRPASSKGNIPRRYEGELAAYLRLRIEGKKDHAAALSVMRGTPTPAHPSQPQRP